MTDDTITGEVIETVHVSADRDGVMLQKTHPHDATFIGSTEKNGKYKLVRVSDE